MAGLYSKFRVERTDGRNDEKDQHARYFVLNYVGDRHARNAMLSYASSVEADNPRLAADIRSDVAQSYRDFIQYGDTP